jgi:hypothetical protein
MSNIHNTTPTHREMLDQVTQASKEAYMNTQNTEHTLNALIDRTLVIVEEYVDRTVGDMNVMQAMEFVGILMDMRERQQAYERSSAEHVRACGKACTKKPKRK